MLVTKIHVFKQLKIGFGTLKVKFHKLWAVLYSSFGEMDVSEEWSYFLMAFHIYSKIISVCNCVLIFV